MSEDGNRAYAVIDGGLSTTTGTAGIAPADTLNNGFVVLDDGTSAQHTIPIDIAGKLHLIVVDEGGPAGLVAEKSPAAACAAGMPPFPVARIFDISDETNPKQVSRLMLETHDPKNCNQVLPDIAGLGFFTSGSSRVSTEKVA